MRLITWLVTNALALAAAAWLIDGIRFTGPTQGQEEITNKIVPLLVVAVILGVLTSFVKPVLKVLSIPFIILTLGLFLLVINAALLLLAGNIAEALDIGFRVRDFWPSAVLGSIVITVVTWIVDSVISPDDRRRR